MKAKIRNAKKNPAHTLAAFANIPEDAHAAPVGTRLTLLDKYDERVTAAIKTPGGWVDQRWGEPLTADSVNRSVAFHRKYGNPARLEQPARQNPVMRRGNVGKARRPAPLPVAPGSTKWDASAARKRLKAYALKQTKGKRAAALSLYGSFFLYKVPGSDGFTAYKLPFADVVTIKGKRTPAIIPHAISAIHAVLDSTGGRRMKGTTARQVRELRRLTDDLYARAGKPRPVWDKPAGAVATGGQGDLFGRRNPPKRRDTMRTPRPNGDRLALYMSNDPGLMNYLWETAHYQVRAMADLGLDFDGVSNYISDVANERDEDTPFDFAEAYVESQSPEDLAGELFSGDFDDAERWLAATRADYLRQIIGDPQNWYEMTHPKMPIDPMYGEMEIPSRYGWWYENPDAQVETARDILKGASENPPRSNPLTDAQHRASQVMARKMAEYQASHGSVPGSERREAFFRGAGVAHEEAAAGHGYPDPDPRVFYDQAHSADRIITAERENPPRSNPLTDDQHYTGFRRADAEGDAWDQIAAERAGSPWTPSHMINSAREYMHQSRGAAKAHSEALEGRIYPRIGSGKTAQIAYKQEFGYPFHGLTVLDDAGKNPPDGKWITHRTGSHAGQHVLFGPFAGDGFVVVTPYTPRAGTQAIKEAARTYAAIYEQEKGRRLPQGTRYLLIDHANGSTTAHKTLKAAKAAGKKALGIKRAKTRNNAPKKRRQAPQRKNPPKTKARVLVITKAGAKPKMMSLPATAHAEKVGRYYVHKAIQIVAGKVATKKSGWVVTNARGEQVGSTYGPTAKAAAAARRKR